MFLGAVWNNVFFFGGGGVNLICISLITFLRFTRLHIVLIPKLLHLTLTLLLREFGRWRVNSLALERQQSTGVAAPLDPEFIHNIRLLGRRPTLQKITDNIIKKYGTHFLLSATLGGTDSQYTVEDVSFHCASVIIGKATGHKCCRCA